MIGTFLTGLKGAIFESDGTTPAQDAPPQQGAPQQAPTHHPAATGVANYTPIHGVNQDMVEAIRKQTMSRNTALTALMGAADQLKDIIPDPTMRLKAAQKTAGAGRAGKEFADAVIIHLADVDQAEMQFSQGLEGRINTEVGGLKAQAKSAESQVASANSEIQSLQQRIAQLQEEVAAQTTACHQLNSQAAAREAELRTAAEQFKVAAAHVRNELNGHKATILSTLG